jgi:hypothetical protein
VQIGFNARACTGIGKAFIDPGPIFGRSEALLEWGEIVLGIRVPNVREQFGPMTHEVLSPA